MLLSGWRDGQMRAHDAEDGKLLWSIDNCHRGGVTALTARAIACPAFPPLLPSPSSISPITLPRRRLAPTL